MGDLVAIEAGLVKCFLCHGDGKYVEVVCAHGAGRHGDEPVCTDECVVEGPCGLCRGTGRIPRGW